MEKLSVALIRSPMFVGRVWGGGLLIIPAVSDMLHLGLEEVAGGVTSHITQRAAEPLCLVMQDMVVTDSRRCCSG